MSCSKLTSKFVKLDNRRQSETPQELSNTAVLSPVDRVLLLPELLERILDYCASGSELKTLLNLRLVCSTWKRRAFSAFLNFIDQLPTIVAGSEKFLAEFEFRRSQNVNLRSLESFHGCFQLSCDLPLKLAVTTIWDTNVVRVLERFANNVVSLHHYDADGTHIREELFEFMCPVLNDVTLCCSSASKENQDELLTLMQLMKHFITNTSRLKSFEVLLLSTYGNSQEEPAFDLLETDKITRLTCLLPFFLQLTRKHSMKNLKSVYINDVSEKRSLEDSLVKIPFLLNQGENLTELEIKGRQGNRYQIGVMKNLKVLKLQVIEVVGPVISRLLPKLKKLEISGESRIISVFLERKNIFEKVDEIKFSHQDDLVSMDGVDIFVPLALRFPHLTILDYACFDPNLGRLATVTHTIFFKLQRLSILKLKMYVTSVQDLFLLLTNTSPDEIPEDRAVW